MTNKKKVKAYTKRKHIPESKIIEELRSKYNTVSIILCKMQRDVFERKTKVRLITN